MQEDNPAAPDATTGLGSRALRYTIWILAARVISRVVALGTVVVMAHALDATKFGELQTAVTYGALVGAITDIGFTALYVREGAREPAELTRYLNNVASIKLLLVAISVAMLAGCLWFAGIQSLLLPSVALLVLSGYSLLLRSSLYALQQLKFEVLEIVPETAVVLGVVVIGWRLHAGTGFFLWAYAAGAAFANLYFIVVLLRMKILRPRWALEVDLFRTWIRAGIPLAITYLVTTVYFKIDVPILQHDFPDSPQIGWYTLAYRPFEALLFIPATVRTVIFPVLSIYYRGAPNRVLATAEKFFKALAIMGWPITVGLFLLAAQYTDLLGLYPQSAASLRILAIAVVFMFVDNTNAAVFNAIDRQRLFAGVALAGLLVNFVLNVALIPRWGYLAASWDTVATEVVLVTIGWLAMRRALGSLRVVHLVWKPVVAGVVMGAFVVVANPHGRVPLLVVTALAGVLYALLLYILRVADDEEMGIVRRALRLRSRVPAA